ncbi:MAG: nuclear transport factor 2 family protein [Caulobacterales bacterium]
MDDAYAARWYAAWNARDLDAIFALYSEEIEFSSPFVSALGFGPMGVVHGHGMLKVYVEAVLSRVPDLKFEPVALCAGARGHTLIYRTHAGVLVAETHEVDAGRIVRADTFYETNPAARSRT